MLTKSVCGEKKLPEEGGGRRKRKEGDEGERRAEGGALGCVSKWVKSVEGRMDGMKSVEGVQEARRSQGGNCP